MKKSLTAVTACFVFFSLFPHNGSAGNAPDLKGKKYIGKPTAEKSYSGCEGCGERGYFAFSAAKNTVEFAWPGSDMVETGTYKLTGRTLTITTSDGEIYIFSVSKDSREIVYLRDKRVFKHDKFPWK